jgi:hypothetical protein
MLFLGVKVELFSSISSPFSLQDGGYLSLFTECSILMGKAAESNFVIFSKEISHLDQFQKGGR